MLTEPFSLHGQDVRVSASVGMDWFEGGSDVDIETLLRHADMAMYMAKTAGRNGCAAFLPEMDQSVSQRLMVESGMMPWPKTSWCCTTSRKSTPAPDIGCQTLVRWQHPSWAC